MSTRIVPAAPRGWMRSSTHRLRAFSGETGMSNSIWGGFEELVNLGTIST